MTIFAPVQSECEPEGNGQFEVVEEYGPNWMTEHSIIVTDEYNCPGMEAGWMLCTLCGRQLAGYWNVFTHLRGKQHKNQMGWKTAQAALKARAAVTSNTGTSWVPPALPESTASSYPPAPGTTYSALYFSSTSVYAIKLSRLDKVDGSDRGPNNIGLNMDATPSNRTPV